MRPSAETSTDRPRPLYCTSNEPLNAGRKCNKRLGGCNVLLLNTDTTILSITWCCHDEEYFVSEKNMKLSVPTLVGLPSQQFQQSCVTTSEQSTADKSSF